MWAPKDFGLPRRCCWLMHSWIKTSALVKTPRRRKNLPIVRQLPPLKWVITLFLPGFSILFFIHRPSFLSGLGIARLFAQPQSCGCYLGWTWLCFSLFTFPLYGRPGTTNTWTHTLDPCSFLYCRHYKEQVNNGRLLCSIISWTAIYISAAIMVMLCTCYMLMYTQAR